MHEAGEEPAGAATADVPQPWTQGWRRLVLAAGMLAYPAVTASGVSQYSTGPSAVAGYLIVAGYSCCYLVAIIMAARSGLLFWLLLGGMAVLFGAALPFAHEQAFFLYAIIAAVTTALLRWRGLPVMLVGAVASLIVPWAVPSWHTGPGWIQAIMVVFTALPAYAYSEITRTNGALLEARAEIAQLASEAERNRIARDLHDLLGHSLTAITVKAGLARRIGATDASRSLQEIAEVEELSRQALTDVRAAVSSYRDVTLVGELARGRELLRASGVVADLPKATDVVDAAHQELLAWAVREGLTNVVRHARATRCTVTLLPSEVEIRDDGVGGAGAAGNGLTGLRERVAAAGGSVEAGPLSPQGWRLRVSLDPKVGASA